MTQKLNFQESYFYARASINPTEEKKTLGIKRFRAEQTEPKPDGKEKLEVFQHRDFLETHIFCKVSRHDRRHDARDRPERVGDSQEESGVPARKR